MPLALPRIPGIEGFGGPEPDSIAEALAIIGSQPAPAPPRPPEMRAQPNDVWASQARAAGQKNGIDPDLYDRLIMQESGYDEDVIYGRRVSPAGAQGINQFMPATAASLGIDPLDPVAALDAGAKYLKQQIDYFGGDVRKGLAAYNAGAGNVQRAIQAGGDAWENELPEETRQYLSIITGGGTQSAPIGVSPSVMPEAPVPTAGLGSATGALIGRAAQPVADALADVPSWARDAVKSGDTGGLVNLGPLSSLVKPVGGPVGDVLQGAQDVAGDIGAKVFSSDIPGTPFSGYNAARRIGDLAGISLPNVGEAVGRFGGESAVPTTPLDIALTALPGVAKGAKIAGRAIPAASGAFGYLDDAELAAQAAKRGIQTQGMTRGAIEDALRVADAAAPAAKAEPLTDLERAMQQSLRGKTAQVTDPPTPFLRKQALTEAGVDTTDLKTASQIDTRWRQYKAEQTGGIAAPTENTANVARKAYNEALAETDLPKGAKLKDAVRWFEKNVPDADTDETYDLFLRWDTRDLKPGEIIPESRTWVMGDPTDELMDGTSVFDPRDRRFLSTGALNSSYEGDVYLVKGAPGVRGEDAGERIIKAPVVVRKLTGGDPEAATQAARKAAAQETAANTRAGKLPRLMDQLKSEEGAVRVPGGAPQPSPVETATEQTAHTINSLLGVDVATPGLGRIDRATNALKEVTKYGVKEEPLATPIMQGRKAAQKVAESQAARSGAVARTVIKDNFAFDKTGRIANIPGNPTLQDLAARLPEFDQYLTPGQREALDTLRTEAEKYSAVFKQQGLEVGSRPDVMDGGFYLPRGRADLEGVDAPTGPSSRRTGGKKGFEKVARFDSMTQGIDAGYKYADPADALQAYAKDAANRAIDAHAAAQFRALADEEGSLLASTAADRVNPQLRDNVAKLRAQIHGRLETLVRQASRGQAESVAQDRLTRLLKNTEDNLTKSFARLDAAEARGRTTSYMGAAARGPTDVAIARAKAEMRTLDTVANRIAGSTQQAAERGLRTQDAFSATQSDIADMRNQLAGINSDWVRAKKIAAQTPRGMGQIDLPGMQGVSFPDAIANAANKYLESERPITGAGANLLNVPKALNSLLRGLRATADASGLGIQGLLGLANDPAAYGGALKVSVRSLWDDRALGAFVREFDQAAIREGKPTSAEWIAKSLRLGGSDTEYEIGGGLPGALNKLKNAPIINQTNRMFGNFGDALRLGLADTVYRPGKDLQETANAANLLTGWSRGKFLGAAGDFLEFAPRFFQSELELLVKAGTSGGVEGQEARKALVKLIGFGTLITVGANEALGNKGFDYLTPTKDGRLNSNFMRIRALGQDWSVFGPWDSLLRGVVATSQGDVGYMARTKASPVVGMAWDLISGKTFTGEDARTPEAILRGLLPFSLNEADTKSPEVVALGGLGLKSSPMTPNEQRDALAFEQTGKHYNDLMPSEQAKFNATPAAQSLAGARETTDYQKAKEAAYGPIQALQDQHEAAFKAGDLTQPLPDLWHEISIRRDQARVDLEREFTKTFSKYDKDAFDKAIDGYYAQERRNSDGTPDWDGTEAARMGFLEKQDTKTRAWLDDFLDTAKTNASPLRQAYLKYIDEREKAGYFADKADTEALDRANPSQDVLNWYWKGGVKDKAPPALQTADAVNQALAMGLTNRPVKFAGLGRAVNQSPEIQQLWRDQGARIANYMDDSKIVSAYGNRVAGDLYEKSYAQLKPSEQSTVRARIRAGLRDSSPTLTALLAYMGDNVRNGEIVIPRDAEVTAALKALQSRYGGMPVTAGVRYVYAKE